MLWAGAWLDEDGVSGQLTVANVGAARYATITLPRSYQITALVGLDGTPNPLCTSSRLDVVMATEAQRDGFLLDVIRPGEWVALSRRFVPECVAAPPLPPKLG